MANVAIYNARYSIQSGNWSGARDTVWELEGSTLYSLGTGGEHARDVVIQSGNWMRARDVVIQ